MSSGVLIRRLTFCEAAGGVLLAVATLPFSSPWTGAPPLWVQLLGITFLLGMFAAKLVVLRRIITAVTLTSLHDVLRLHLAVGGYALAVFLLFPLPPSWSWFWFTLTFLGAALGSGALARMRRTAPFR
ncbi:MULTISPECIES: hypothetical protein [Mycobacteroides]|jgi:hypothetical protein|uniref:Uncharacterized protein n=1 Tax=Mycobacteroides chelonae TaxID=1774 RepID=A0A1S1LRY6_MYCCH|nr:MULTISPECIES: hypothetical protein [Mycobacteroides]KRQ25065.1 hypothetical protein AOT91_21580 [Mycobacteroides sp. H092]KRQ27440.1 hypothetical protein AOT87_00685 [Mycobacteroides sp. H003]KRQ46817.1 hypothetical protein AOT92_01145 [Mycobacteroides sp. H101]KRQ51777.1 hypothetical protein AOT88_04535 [Mycobacteroides sp. H063]KRQ61494.1 hypothetical protein AOT94_04945 [Mycobacteroides sp. HXVII]